MTGWTAHRWSRDFRHRGLYLEPIEALLSPALIIIGGGVSAEPEKFLPQLTGLKALVVPARMHNNAEIVGAAMTPGLIESWVSAADQEAGR